MEIKILNAFLDKIKTNNTWGDNITALNFKMPSTIRLEKSLNLYRWRRRLKADSFPPSLSIGELPNFRQIPVGFASSSPSSYVCLLIACFFFLFYLVSK